MEQREIQKIRNVLIVAEQGTQKMKYSDVYVYNDGPNNVKQLTLSIGFTEYGGNLGKVMHEYVLQERAEVKELKDYIHQLGKPGTATNQTLIGLLKKAGSDPVMQSTQERMFDKLYLDKGISWGQSEGFTLALSFMVICDSFLHSGSILGFLRAKFPEKTPSGGGDEKKWIRQYTEARHNWLANHTNKLLRNTIYRTNYYKKLIADDDWELNTYHELAMNGIRPLAVA